MTRVSYFASETERAPRPLEVTWEQLTGQLSSPVIAPCTLETCGKGDHALIVDGKSKGCRHKYIALWSPAVYPAGSTRGKKNVSAVSLLVLDLDHMTEEKIVEVAERLQPYRYIAHATHSDRPGDRCLRVVLEMSEPVTGADWSRFWSTAVAELGVPVDPQTCDASRLYFLPSRPSDGDFLHDTNEGKSLDTAAILAKAPPLQQVEPVTIMSTPVADPAALQRAAVQLAAVWPDKGRHFTSLALAGALAQHGWPEETIATFIAEVTRLAGGEPELEKRRQQAADSIAKVQRGEVVSGWGTVAENLTRREVVTEVRERLGMRDPEVAAFDAIMTVQQPAPQPSALATGTYPNLDVLAQPKIETATPRISTLLGDIARKPKTPMLTYSTGIPELDQLLGGGFNTRQVVGVLGPPSLGKSNFVATSSLFLQRSRWGLCVSTELENDELVARFAAQELGVPWRDCVKGVVDRQAQQRAVENLRIRAIGCDVLPRTNTIAAVEAEALAMATEYGETPIIVIDYVQLLARGGEDGIRARVGELTQQIREMAQRLDTVVIAVFTVARAWYTDERREKMRKADDPRLFLAAAKECGEVEYDCATILFLDVDGETTGEGEEKYRRASIAVARCRGGDDGFAGARFYVSSGRWVADPLARREMMTGEGAAQRQLKRVDEAVATLVEKVRTEIAGGKYRTKTQWRDSGYPDIKKTLDRALETEQLEIAEVYRKEGLKEQLRDCVVYKGWTPNTVDHKPNVSGATPILHPSPPLISEGES